MTAAFQSRVLPDSNLLNGESLARVEYRREGERRWKHFLVVLDDDTTFELVEANVEQMIAVYEAQRPEAVAKLREARRG